MTTERRNYLSLRYLGKAGRVIHHVATDPIEAWLRLRERLMDRQERDRRWCPYGIDGDWESRLHKHLGMPWPCSEAEEFWRLWSTVLGSLHAKGLGVGVRSFAGWNDAEPEFVRAIWCLTRHLRPLKVVETGVARGVTSRFILEALERNECGHLWSIDLPQLLDPELNREIGTAVDPRLHHRWSYIKGSSRRRLAKLLSSLGQIELFVHDSRHTEYNTLFELDRAWTRLAPGGTAVIDDIDVNWGFRSFLQANPGYAALTCPAMPLQQDPRRLDGRGLFGIILKCGPSHISSRHMEA